MSDRVRMTFPHSETPCVLAPMVSYLRTARGHTERRREGGGEGKAQEQRGRGGTPSAREAWSCTWRSHQATSCAGISAGVGVCVCSCASLSLARLLGVAGVARCAKSFRSPQFSIPACRPYSRIARSDSRRCLRGRRLAGVSLSDGNGRAQGGAGARCAAPSLRPSWCLSPSTGCQRSAVRASETGISGMHTRMTHSDRT